MEKELTQRERVRQELMEISGNVSSKDKIEYMEKAKLSSSTISCYLKGQQSTLETGLGMLLFFRKKIEERELQITGNEETHELINA